MNWRKLGLIFQPDRGLNWMRTHAQLPTPLQLRGSLFRIFFSCRDDRGRAHVGAFDIDLDKPNSIIAVTQKPVLEPGGPGFFDGDGIYAASALRRGEVVYLYTIGYNAGATPPMFYPSIGIAISRDGGENFKKVGRAPIMARSEFDPCLVTSPMVLFENGIWRMWYVSGTKWDETPTGLVSRYHIKYADSDDGRNWRREGHVCIDQESGDETNIARCCVVAGRKGYRAWYSYDRGEGYRIGYAESDDGLTWRREDAKAGLAPSNNGWDSEAMAYPYVVAHKNHLYMFYNGNDFGRDGIGLAISEDTWER